MSFNELEEAFRMCSTASDRLTNALLEAYEISPELFPKRILEMSASEKMTVAHGLLKLNGKFLTAERA